MIAMAIACNPRLLIADEPTTALDVTMQAQILDLLVALQRDRGMALILITHDLAVVAETAQRVVVMYAGQQVETGPVPGIFATPTHPYTQALLAALPEHNVGPRPAAGDPRRRSRAARPADRLPAVPALPVRARALPPRVAGAGRTGRAARPLPLPARRRRPAGARLAGRVRSRRGDRVTTAAPLLEARALTRHYTVSRGLWKPKGLVRALDGATFTVAAGQTLAVVGESGCGKSTLARQVTMIERPTSGALLLDGTDVGTADAAARRRLRPLVQMVFQNPYASLNPRKKVGTLLEEPLAINTTLDAAARRDAAESDDGARGPAPRALPALSAHVLRRPAAAHRRRPGADAEAAAGRRRRAGLGARRLDPGAGAQPADGPAAGDGDRLPVHLAQPAGRPAHRRHRRRDVPRADRRARAEGGGVRAGRRIRTPARCSRARRCSIPRRGASASASPASCRRRSIRRPAARSTSAARTRCRAARPRSPRCSRWARRRSPATAPPSSTPERPPDAAAAPGASH